MLRIKVKRYVQQTRTHRIIITLHADGTIEIVVEPWRETAVK